MKRYIQLWKIAKWIKLYTVDNSTSLRYYIIPSSTLLPVGLIKDNHRFISSVQEVFYHWSTFKFYRRILKIRENNYAFVCIRVIDEHSYKYVIRSGRIW